MVEFSESTAALWSTLLASFLASLVEIVEAFTIVLAVVITHTWRAAWIGTGLALALLAAMVIVLGPLLAFVPLAAMQFVVGVLLGLFGMRWLRKAILRASGFIALHDEDALFREETELLKTRSGSARADKFAMLAAFKAVLLEGVEVVFIVIAMGSTTGLMIYASAGAVLAAVLVLCIGLLVHRPLSRVPENSLKFVVGLMLTSFSIFWLGESLGVVWPGADLFILALVALFAALSFGLILMLRRWQRLLAEGAPS
jgi:uncharacterized membrane protein